MEGLRGRKEKTQVGGTDDQLYFDWQLYDLFDPLDITQSSSIKVTIARKGQPEQERTWLFRWGQTDAKLHKFSGDSKYKLSMNFA
jgi:hypothetical protein